MTAQPRGGGGYVNRTIASEGVGKVIVIKPKNENAFKSVEIKDIQINRRKAICVVELSEPNLQKLKEFCSIEKIGTWDVECYIPNKDKYKYGVISPIDVEVDLESFRGQLVTDENVNIVKIERLRKQEGRDSFPSESVQITFDGEILPKAVKYNFVRYPIRKYEFPPLQCYNCQQLSHTATGCTRKVRCLVCALVQENTTTKIVKVTS